MQQKTAFESACGDFEAWRDAATANVFDSDPFFQRLIATPPDTTAAHIRHVVDRMCRLMDWVALASQARWNLEHDGEAETLDALELCRLAELDRVDPLDCEEWVDLNRRVASEL